MLLNCKRESKSRSMCPHLLLLAYFWVQPGYSIGRKDWFGFLRLQWENMCEVMNLKCFWYDWRFFNITRFMKNHIWFLKLRGNWRTKLVCSLTKNFCRVGRNLTRLYLTKYNIFNCATFLVHGLFILMGFIITSIDQQIGTVDGNKLKGEARPGLLCTSITPKN